MVASQGNAPRGPFDKAFTVPPRSLRDYLAIKMAGSAGYDPATFSSTGRCTSQLCYDPNGPALPVSYTPSVSTMPYVTVSVSGAEPKFRLWRWLDSNQHTQAKLLSIMLCSVGRIRTCDQSVNSRLHYRCATTEQRIIHQKKKVFHLAT